MESNAYDYEVQKEKLKRSTEDLKKALEVEIDHIKENASEWGKVILVAGGAVFLTYMVIRAFTKRKPKKAPSAEIRQGYYPVPVKQPNALVRRILDHITFFVLGIIQQKLVQYLEQKHTHEKRDS